MRRRLIIGTLVGGTTGIVVAFVRVILEGDPRAPGGFLEGPDQLPGAEIAFLIWNGLIAGGLAIAGAVAGLVVTYAIFADRTPTQLPGPEAVQQAVAADDPAAEKSE